MSSAIILPHTLRVMLNEFLLFLTYSENKFSNTGYHMDIFLTHTNKQD